MSSLKTFFVGKAFCPLNHREQTENLESPFLINEKEKPFVGLFHCHRHSHIDMLLLFMILVSLCIDICSHPLKQLHYIFFFSSS